MRLKCQLNDLSERRIVSCIMKKKERTRSADNHINYITSYTKRSSPGDNASCILIFISCINSHRDIKVVTEQTNRGYHGSIYHRKHGTRTNVELTYVHCQPCRYIMSHFHISNFVALLSSKTTILRFLAYVLENLQEIRSIFRRSFIHVQVILLMKPHSFKRFSVIVLLSDAIVACSYLGYVFFVFLLSFHILLFISLSLFTAFSFFFFYGVVAQFFYPFIFRITISFLYFITRLFLSM